MVRCACTRITLALTLDAKARQGLLDGELKGSRSIVPDGSVGKLGWHSRPRGRWAPISKRSLAALDPDLPFDLALDWKSLSWPLHKPAKG